MTTPFQKAYPAPWRMQGAEVVDAQGCHVNGFDDDDADEVEFWRGVVEAVNFQAAAGVRLAYAWRYEFLRERDLETVSKGGVFAGRTPHNIVLNGEDLDRAIDDALELEAAR